MPTRVLLVSIVPPRNDGGVRIVMHRHLVDRKPFDLHVASTADFANNLLVHTPLRLPYLLWRLKKSRFGPWFRLWLKDYENLVWPLTVPVAFDQAIKDFKPDVILTLAETGLCHIAAKAAKRHRLPLVGWFQDWFPIMPSYYGHERTQSLLSRRYQTLYQECDLALCIGDGMKEVLGAHPNSHVLYPMPGTHRIPDKTFPPKSNKFRLVYVGAVRTFYGRMLSALLECLENETSIEIIAVGGNADWPAHILDKARARGIYLGFLPPEKADEILAGADALLVVMSFEKEHEHFMRTSFTSKFVHYTTFHKPIVFWAPDYCTPMRLVRREGGALPVSDPSPNAALAAIRSIASDVELRARLAAEARNLNATTFNPDRLQDVFVSQINALVGK